MLVLDVHISTTLALLMIGMVVAYRSSAFHKKGKLGDLSLLQTIYMLAPLLALPFLYEYIQVTKARQLMAGAPFKSGIIENMIIVSAGILYGGAVVHGTSKTVAVEFKRKGSRAYKTNRFFHLTFSHNLTYVGMVMLVLSIVAMELSFDPIISREPILLSAIKGVLIGVGFVAGLMMYDPFAEGGYKSRWSDLKTTFMSLWLGLPFVLYIAYKVDPDWNRYQLAVSLLTGLAVTLLLSLGLLLRYLRRKKVHVGRALRLRGLMKLIEYLDEVE